MPKTAEAEDPSLLYLSAPSSLDSPPSSALAFIRCLKPDSFDPKMIVDKLRYGGVLEAVSPRLVITYLEMPRIENPRVLLLVVFLAKFGGQAGLVSRSHSISGIQITRQ